jgi:ABC-type uncharacterized transport system substrate-binding protein
MTASRVVLAVTLTIGLLAAPLAHAQQAGKVYRIGLLKTRTPTFSPVSDPHDKAFLDGLQDLGYILGQNLAIEVRTVEREPDGPGALVASKVDVILAPSTSPALAAKKVTSTVPIVLYTSGRAGALIVLPHPTFFMGRKLLAEFAVTRRLPLISEYRDFAAAGGLVGYGPSLVDLARRAATYVDKILKGAKPADLPVEQPTKFELVINRASRES